MEEDLCVTCLSQFEGGVVACGVYPMLSSGLSLCYKWIILFKALLPVLFKLHIHLLFSWKAKDDKST